SPCCINFIAQYLVNGINATDSYVTASCQGGTCSNTNPMNIILTAKTTGGNTNYSLSAGSSYDTTSSCYDYFGNFASPCFTQASFTATASGLSLTGGSDGVTVYDSGTVTVTLVGVGFTASAPYGQSSNSTAEQVAAALVGTGPTGLNRPGSPVH